ncbi:MAG: hypothetical protein Q9210_006603 [Variospora velana]
MVGWQGGAYGEDDPRRDQSFEWDTHRGPSSTPILGMVLGAAYLMNMYIASGGASTMNPGERGLSVLARHRALKWHFHSPRVDMAILLSTSNPLGMQEPLVRQLACVVDYFSSRKEPPNFVVGTGNGKNAWKYQAEKNQFGRQQSDLNTAEHSNEDMMRLANG